MRLELWFIWAQSQMISSFFNSIRIFSKFILRQFSSDLNGIHTLNISRVVQLSYEHMTLSNTYLIELNSQKMLRKIRWRDRFVVRKTWNRKRPTYRYCGNVDLCQLYIRSQWDQLKIQTFWEKMKMCAKNQKSIIATL